MPSTKRKSHSGYGPSEKRDFHVYDKVFARMRGYPPWPAKITNIPVDSKSKSLKNKCEVYFYGTHQLGQCAFQDIHDYEANRERFSNCASKKVKNFARALEEIENDNGPLLEDIGDDGSVAKISFDKSMDSVDERKGGVKRKAESLTTDGDPETDKCDSEEEANGQTSTTGSARQSVSNKHTKPAADHKSPAAVDKTTKTSKPAKTPLSEAHSTSESSKSRTPLPKEQRSSSSVSDKKEIKPLASKKLRASDVHSSTPRPQKSWTKMLEEKEDPFAHLGAYEQEKPRESKTSELRTECSLLTLESDIKESLPVTQADFDRAISAMKSIAKLKLTPLMLKKNEHVVDTFRKLEKYVGEKVKRMLPDSEWSVFESRAKEVRNLATMIIKTKFHPLFSIPSGMSFIEHYRDELVWYLKKTAEMSPRERLSLTTHDGYN